MVNSRLQQLGLDAIQIEPAQCEQHSNRAILQRNTYSCSHCTGATFETEQKTIRYSVNIVLVSIASNYKLKQLGQMMVSPLLLSTAPHKELSWCMIKILMGRRGGDTLEILPPPPLHIISAFTHPSFKLF